MKVCSLHVLHNVSPTGPQAMALYTILLRSRSRAVRGEGLSDVLCMGTGMVVGRKETTSEDVCEGD